MQALCHIDSARQDHAATPPPTTTDAQADTPQHTHDGQGRQAPEPLAHPARLRLGDWKIILRRTLKSLIFGPTTLVAAGCAFYSTLSLFPAISSLISIYGLAFDVQTVAPQMDTLRHLLPPTAFALIYDRVQTLVAEPHTSLTMNLIVSLTVALWSASAATRSIISALNMAYNVHESRNFFVFQITAFALTLSAVLGAALTIALMVAIPLLLSLPALLHIPTPPGSVEFIGRWSGSAVMFSFEILALSALYRYGPDRKRRTHWRWVLPGTVAATLAWILSSQLFSYYVAHLASYNATYGSLGAVIATMMWFFVTAWVVLMGAELNAEMESYVHGRQRQIAWQDTTSEKNVDGPTPG
ncbi:YihY/virulence factor BrkB family protein [Acetobacter sp. TBRC 12305]|uniref:YihY/virulence factor BrkB family protein n=1 Tax=Acetobacter garciniae TaxID=2817435 RepID=A0A939KQ04_9PROT|nr:YihY/virulence factor BrkB family protein [Acetobacter garciniae]MBO1324684.1 YihY/virulence factor BrkB family protein [Acetobacter garciniae]MBX0344374.1 YihY/virulence factor BrkB family protein [Acetobacter garciniae]